MKANRAIAMWEAGKTTPQIAAELGCTRQWARKLLVKAGIDVNKRPTPIGVEPRKKAKHRPRPKRPAASVPKWATHFDPLELDELRWLVDHAGLVIDEIPTRSVPLVVATVEAGVQRRAAHLAWLTHLERHRGLANDSDGGMQVERAQRAAVQSRNQWVELLRSIGMTGTVFDLAKEEQVVDVGIPEFEVVK